MENCDSDCYPVFGVSQLDQELEAEFTDEHATWCCLCECEPCCCTSDTTDPLVSSSDGAWYDRSLLSVPRGHGLLPEALVLDSPAVSFPDAQAQGNVRSFGHPGVASAGRGEGGAGRVSQSRKRLRARAFFLTYSQTKLDKADVYQYLAGGRPKRLIVALETHEDGGLHIHATVEYGMRKDVTPFHFDFRGEHPNVQAANSAGGPDAYDRWLLNHWNYCKKEDAMFLYEGEEPPGEGRRKQKRDDTFRAGAVIATREGVAPAMTWLLTNSPYETLIHNDALYRALVRLRNDNRPRAPARPLESFQRKPLIVEGWCTLFFSGPTGTGKTSFARALLPEATIVRHRDQLRDCDFSKGVIFDDFDVAHWPPTAAIHLLDWEEESGIDIKHSHVIIPPRTRKIITSNNDFDRWVPKDASDEQVSAMRRRVTVIKIHSSIY